jgi:hypothetical protein
VARARSPQIRPADLLARPLPPVELIEDIGEGLPRFVTAPEVEEWLRKVLISEGGPLYSESHSHLADALIACQWTDVENTTKQRRIFATAEIPMPPPAAGKWTRARWEADLHQRFGYKPDFLITIDAVLAAEASDAEWCRVARHELLHCGQMLDRDQRPMFDQDGNPRFGMRGHDFEEFWETWEDFGADPVTMERLRRVVEGKPRVGPAETHWACGTCLRRVA